MRPLLVLCFLSSAYAADSFQKRLKQSGLVYSTPAGYSEAPVRPNLDVNYDYAVERADKRVELRFALRPYSPGAPAGLKSRQFSSAFFSTAVLNLIHGGHTGNAAPPQPTELEHFAADQASIVVLRWFKSNNQPRFFGRGFEMCAVVFMHRDGVGDAYTFVLFRDRGAVDTVDEELMHTLRFAPRGH